MLFLLRLGLQLESIVLVFRCVVQLSWMLWQSHLMSVFLEQGKFDGRWDCTSGDKSHQRHG
jgi:hypothetical protein